jgi:hypothetical protein
MITEFGEFLIFGSPEILDEWGERKIDGLMEDGRRVIIIVVTETIVAKEFPMSYLGKPIKAEELRSKVEGATVTVVSKDYPLVLKKKGKQQELVSKWS